MDTTPDNSPPRPRRVRLTDAELARLLGTSKLSVRQSGTDGGFVIQAQMSHRQVRNVFVDSGDKYPEIMTYEQAAKMVHVSVSTLKGWFSEGRYADCVKRGKPGRVLRDAFLKEFMKDGFG